MFFKMLLWALSPLFVSLTASTTVWPFAAISWALMKPKPVFAPVITTTLGFGFGASSLDAAAENALGIERKDET